MHVWKTIKVFASSTFRDLELERDKLSNIFAQIKQDIYKRHLTLIPYDLRWREKGSQEPIVKWCIDMVSQCQYFIGILGYRYGWRPETDAKDNGNKRRLSITEMEIEKAISSIEKHRRFFCFGDLSQYSEELQSKESEEDKQSLEKLKNSLRERGETIFEFQNTKELLNTVEKQLREIIDSDYPPHEQVSLETYTRKEALAEIIEQKIRGFVGRKTYMNKVFDFLKQGDNQNYLAIHANAGTGKSSLLAYLLKKMEKEKSNIPVIAHFMSMTGESNQVRNIVLSLGQQMHELGILEEKLEEDPQELRAQVRETLEQSQKPFVLVIDGIDEVEENGQDLLWLPRTISQNIRVIITTRPVVTLRVLEGYPHIMKLELAPLNENEIYKIIDEYAHRNNIHFEETDKDLLIKRADGNPLYLKVALEEIGASGMAVGQLATSIDSLFEQILQRLCNKFEEKIVFGYLGLLVASRTGLAESELRELFVENKYQGNKCTDDLLLSVTKSLDNFIVYRAGVLNFFHPEFERSIKQRIGRRKMRIFHKDLADYFHKKGFLYERALLELCYQQMWSEEYRKLLLTLSDFHFMKAKCKTGMADSLMEDFSMATGDSSMALPGNLKVDVEGVEVTKHVIALIEKALNLDLRFIRKHPELILQSLWNRCYWHDVPHARGHYKQISSEFRGKLYHLAEKWRKMEEGREFSWLKSRRPLYPHLNSALGKILKRHSEGICSVKFSNDGKFVLSSSEDNTIRIWDIESGESLLTLDGHGDSVTDACFNGKGDRVASVSVDGIIVYWDAQSGECLQIIDGKIGPLSSVTLDKQGHWVAAGAEDGNTRIWNLDTGNCTHIFEGHKDSIHGIAINSEGTILVSASKDQTVRIWDIETSKCIEVFREHDRMVNSVSISGNGKYLASGSKDTTICIWELSSRKLLSILRGHSDSVSSVCFSQDSKKLISGSEDSTVRVWDVESGHLDITLQRHDWKVTSVDMSFDNKLAVCGAGDSTISLWNITGNEDIFLLKGHRSPVKQLSPFSDHKRMATGAGKVLGVWNIESGAFLQGIEKHDSTIFHLAISKDQKKVAVGTYCGIIQVWDMETSHLMYEYSAHKGRSHNLEFTCNDKYLVSAGFFDKLIKVWDMETGRGLHMLFGHEKWIQSLGFDHKNRRIVSGGRDKTARIWDIETGECIRVLRGVDSSVTSVCFSPDDTKVLGGSYGGPIYMWDVQSGACHMIFHGHSYIVDQIAFSKDQKYIYSTSKDGTTRIWDNTGQNIKTLEGRANIIQMASENNPFYPLTNDWETMIMSKKDNKAVAYLGDRVENGWVCNNTFIGSGNIATSYVYILEIVGVDN